MRSIAIAFTCLAMMTGQALADSVEIDFIHPVQKDSKPNKPTVIPTEYSSGWPLTIELTMIDELGIASTAGNDIPFFVGLGQSGFVVFDDPDGCLVFNEGASWQAPLECFFDDDGDPGTPGVLPPSDELYVEFTPDLDAAGAKDFTGNRDRRDGLLDATSGRQQILTNYDPRPSTPEFEAQEIGARTGSQMAILHDTANEHVLGQMGEILFEEISDGVGYGADDDLPGLVLIAKHGPGIMYESDGVAKSPLELVNLAGFINTVSYELNNTKSRTTVNAHMVVPRFLFSPVIVADDCYGPLESCEVWWRVDGAETEVPAASIVGEPVSSTYKDGFKKLVDQTTFTISAMVVSGVGPNSVVDGNGDGQIDEADLELMGYTVLGHKKSMSFYQYSAEACFGGSGDNVAYADLDGNGEAVFGDVCPAGPGSISKPPR